MSIICTFISLNVDLVKKYYQETCTLNFLIYENSLNFYQMRLICIMPYVKAVRPAYIRVDQTCFHFFTNHLKIIRWDAYFLFIKLDGQFDCLMFMYTYVHWVCWATYQNCLLWNMFFKLPANMVWCIFAFLICGIEVRRILTELSGIAQRRVG